MTNSKSSSSSGGCGGYIAGAIIMVLALLPSGVIAIIPYFMFKNISNQRESFAWWTMGVSGVITWVLYYFLMYKGISDGDITKAILFILIGLGAICYYIIYLDVKKSNPKASPNKSPTIPLISTIMVLVGMYYVFWQSYDDLTVISYIVFYGTLFFFLSLFVFGEPKTAKTKTDDTTRLKASPNESAPDVPSSNAKNEYDTSKLTKIEKSYPAIAMTVVSVAGSIIGYFSESILLIFVLAILGGIIGFIFGLWVLSRIIEKKSSPTYNISTKPSHNSNNYKPKTSLNQMKPSQETTFNFCIPPEDFDAKYAAEITHMFKKVFGQLLGDKKESLILNASEKHKTIEIIQLMGNAYSQLTVNYFASIVKLEALKSKSFKFVVNSCKEEYLEEEYNVLVNDLKSKINKKHSEQLKTAKNKYNTFVSSDYKPSNLEIVLVETTHPSSISGADTFLKGFNSAFEYFCFDDFNQQFLLSCIVFLGKKEVIDEHYLSGLFEEYNAAIKLKPIIDFALDSIKEFSDMFYGPVRINKKGLSDLDAAMLQLRAYDDRFDFEKKDLALKKLIELMGGKKIYLLIFKKDFKKVHRFINIIESNYSIQYLLQSKKVQTGL